jgi:TetR/AcrR family transcriptional regulator
VSDENRSRILHKALGLFVAHGYDGVGVQQIAEAAGITKPTLYHYFGNKAGLLAAMLDESVTPFQQALTAAGGERDVLAALTSVAKVTFDFALEQPNLYRLLLSLWFAPQKSEAYQAARGYHERHYAIIERLFRRIAKDRHAMKGHHQFHAATFLGMLNNCVSLALNGYVALDDSLLQRSVHQFVYGFLS